MQANLQRTISISISPEKEIEVDPQRTRGEQGPWPASVSLSPEVSPEVVDNVLWLIDISGRRSRQIPV